MTEALNGGAATPPNSFPSVLGANGGSPPGRFLGTVGAVVNVEGWDPAETADTGVISGEWVGAVEVPVCCCPWWDVSGRERLCAMDCSCNACRCVWWAGMMSSKMTRVQ